MHWVSFEKHLRTDSNALVVRWPHWQHCGPIGLMWPHRLYFGLIGGLVAPLAVLWPFWMHCSPSSYWVSCRVSCWVSCWVSCLVALSVPWMTGTGDPLGPVVAKRCQMVVLQDGLLLAATDLRHVSPLCVIRKAFDSTLSPLSLAPSNITHKDHTSLVGKRLQKSCMDWCRELLGASGSYSELLGMKRCDLLLLAMSTF